MNSGLEDLAMQLTWQAMFLDGQKQADFEETFVGCSDRGLMDEAALVLRPDNTERFSSHFEESGQTDPAAIVITRDVWVRKPLMWSETILSLSCQTSSIYTCPGCMHTIDAQKLQERKKYINYDNEEATSC